MTPTDKQELINYVIEKSKSCYNFDGQHLFLGLDSEKLIARINQLPDQASAGDGWISVENEIKTIQSKFKSGNSVDVERVSISRIDVDRLLQMSFDRYPLKPNPPSDNKGET